MKKVIICIGIILTVILSTSFVDPVAAENMRVYEQWQMAFAQRPPDVVEVLDEDQAAQYGLGMMSCEYKNDMIIYTEYDSRTKTRCTYFLTEDEPLYQLLNEGNLIMDFSARQSYNPFNPF